MSKTKANLLLKFLFLTTLVLFFFNGSTNAQEEAQKQADEIYSNYLKAIGGKDNLDKIKTIETISELDGMGRKLKQTVIEDKINNKKYSVFEGGSEGNRETGFDGSRFWEKSARFTGYRDSFPTDSLNPKNLRKLSNETLNGKECFVLESKLNNMTVKAYFDTTSYFLIKTEAHGEVSGMAVSKNTIFDDYRKVENVMVPFLRFFGGSQEKVLSVKFNVGVDPKIFELEKDNKEDKKASEQTTPQSTRFTLDSNLVYKDENAKTITQTEFLQKQTSGNFQVEPEVLEGKIVGMRLKKSSQVFSIGALAPDFEGKLFDDTPIRLNGLKGKMVVLNFWFVECAPCIKEIPELNNLVKKYQGKEVEFLSITFNSKELVTEFFKKHAFDYKHIVNGQNIFDLYQTNAFPTHIVLDKEGKILFNQFGYTSNVVGKMSEIIDKNLGISTESNELKK